MSVSIGAYGVSYSYTPGERVLNDVSFELEGGHVVALLGANGSGKSTLLRIISGLSPLSASGERVGLVRLMGKDLREYSSLSRAARVVYASSDLRAEFPITAHEVVMLGGMPLGQRAFGRLTAEDEDRIEWAMHECMCWNLRHRELATLSGGERQLVQLARALVQGSKVLLLDEALSKMDLHHQARMGEFFARLRSRDYTVVLVAHDWNLACEWADQALVLHNGTLVKSGAVGEVVTGETLRLLYPESALIVSSHPVSGAPKVFFGRK